jgi:hypothetical protein
MSVTTTPQPLAPSHQHLAPSARDFEIYESVAIHGLSRASPGLPRLTTVLGTTEPRNKRTRFLHNLPCET